jgi:hypothetical protein
MVSPGNTGLGLNRTCDTCLIVFIPVADVLQELTVILA